MITVYQLPLGPLSTNCYILGCQATRRAAVIDPSWDGAAIKQKLDEEGLELSHILLTHTHFDHVGGLAELKALTGAPVWGHQDAIPMLERAETMANLWGIYVEPPPPIDELLTEGQRLHVGEIELEVMETPGHAPGHVSFYVPSHHLLFDGDVLFQEGIGRTDFPGGSYQLLMQTIWEKFMTLPDETRVLSGHGAVTTIGDERLRNPFLQE